MREVEPVRMPRAVRRRGEAEQLPSRRGVREPRERGVFLPGGLRVKHEARHLPRVDAARLALREHAHGLELERASQAVRRIDAQAGDAPFADPARTHRVRFPFARAFHVEVGVAFRREVDVLLGTPEKLVPSGHAAPHRDLDVVVAFPGERHGGFHADLRVAVHRLQRDSLRGHPRIREPRDVVRPRGHLRALPRHDIRRKHSARERYDCCQHEFFHMFLLSGFTFERRRSGQS